jgi:hypothetical protein
MVTARPPPRTSATKHGQSSGSRDGVQASPLIGFGARDRPRDLRRDRAATRATDVRQDQHQTGAPSALGSSASVAATSTAIRAHERHRHIRSIFALWHLVLDSLGARSNLLNTSPLRKKLGAFCGTNRDPKSSEIVACRDPSSEMIRSQVSRDPKSADKLRNSAVIVAQPHRSSRAVVTVTQPQILITLAVIGSSWFRIIRADPA